MFRAWLLRGRLETRPNMRLLYFGLTWRRSSNFGLPSKIAKRAARFHRNSIAKSEIGNRGQSKPMQKLCFELSDPVCDTRLRHTIYGSLQTEPWLCASVCGQPPSDQPKVVSRELRYFVITNGKLLERCLQKRCFLYIISNSQKT